MGRALEKRLVDSHRRLSSKLLAKAFKLYLETFKPRVEAAEIAYKKSSTVSSTIEFLDSSLNSRETLSNN